MTPNDMGERETCAWIITRLEAHEAKPILRTDLYNTRSLHCPSCDGTALVELDWDVRFNMLQEPVLEEDGTISVFVHQSQSDYTTVTWVCTDCDQALDMTDIHTYWG